MITVEIILFILVLLDLVPRLVKHIMIFCMDRNPGEKWYTGCCSLFWTMLKVNALHYIADLLAIYVLYDSSIKDHNDSDGEEK